MSKIAFFTNISHIFQLGGVFGIFSKKTEIYDIKTDKWSQGKDLNEDATEPYLVSINNQYLYSIGGTFIDRAFLLI